MNLGTIQCANILSVIDVKHSVFKSPSVRIQVHTLLLLVVSLRLFDFLLLQGCFEVVSERVYMKAIPGYPLEDDECLELHCVVQHQHHL